jgi:putative tryptophan/tyrosine transport system substrate-binding protein
MRRRDFISALSGAAWSLTAHAEPLKQMRRVGFLRVGPPPASFIDGFRQGLRELGYVEGQHYVIEYSLAQSAAQIPEAAAELVRRKVVIIVASGTPSVLPARDAAGQIPVVFVAAIDPVATGLVASLARPGGNITGMTTISTEVIAKRVQMVRELLPKLSKIALLVREPSPDMAQYVKESETAVRNLGIELQIEIERDPKDLEGVFLAARGANALLVVDDAEFTTHRAQIAELALRNLLPTVSGVKELAEAGCLMAYGPSFEELYRRAASHVFKILQGANIADLPIEQPVKFDFVLNMRTAKALGITIPPSLLALADEVIE